MDILFMLIPLSVVLVFAVIGIFAWALNAGQFDDLEREGERILSGEETTPDARSGNVDSDQSRQ
jgi:cbb3-type cytochrome oxidase maturation protein